MVGGCRLLLWCCGGGQVVAGRAVDQGRCAEGCVGPQRCKGEGERAGMLLSPAVLLSGSSCRRSLRLRLFCALLLRSARSAIMDYSRANCLGRAAGGQRQRHLGFLHFPLLAHIRPLVPCPAPPPPPPPSPRRNIQVPGFSKGDIKPYQRRQPSADHQCRMAAVRKTMAAAAAAAAEGKEKEGGAAAAAGGAGVPQAGGAAAAAGGDGGGTAGKAAASAAAPGGGSAANGMAAAPQQQPQQPQPQQQQVKQQQRITTCQTSSQPALRRPSSDSLVA